MKRIYEITSRRHYEYKIDNGKWTSSHMTKECCFWYVVWVVYLNMCVSFCTPTQNSEEDTGCLPLLLPLLVLLS